MNDIQIFSPTELSKASFQHLLPEFFEEFTADYQLLKEAFETDNNCRLKRIAHKMKGSAASYSAVLLFKKAKVLQEAVGVENTDSLQFKITELGEGITHSYDYAVYHFKIA